MFTRRPDAGGIPAVELARAISTSPASSAPPRQSAASTGRGPSVIGPDLLIVGNLHSKGEVHIEGEIQGDLQAGRLIIGQNARVTGSLIAEDIVVQGTVNGSVRGLRVALHGSSKVEGDVYHQSLAIEQGAYFEGKSRRAENPLAVPVPDTQPATEGAMPVPFTRANTAG